MVAMATALIIMEGIGESLMDGAILIMAGVTPTMDGVLHIMDMDTVMDTVMDMDTALDMDMLIIEEEEVVVMPEEQLIEEITIDILVEEQGILTVEDLILQAEAVPILEVNPAGDQVIVMETQVLDDQDPQLTIEVTQAEDHLITQQDQVLAQDPILIEVLAEALEVVVVAATEVAEVVVLVAAAEDAAEVNT